MKEKLKNYRALKLELEDVDAQINSGTVQDSVQASQREYPWVKGTRRIRGVPDEDYSLLVRKSDLKAQIREIEEFVDKIADKEIRTIIMLRFIRGKRPKSWQSIAMKLGYGSEHTPKRKIENFLKMAEMADFE